MIHTPQPLITSLTRRRLLQGTLRGVAGLTAWPQGWLRPRTAAAQTRPPSGQMTWAIHVQIAPSWFDPAEIPGIFTPFMIMYALHCAGAPMSCNRPVAGTPRVIRRVFWALTLQYYAGQRGE
jgi:hypothetical protein